MCRTGGSAAPAPAELVTTTSDATAPGCSALRRGRIIVIVDPAGHAGSASRSNGVAVSQTRSKLSMQLQAVGRPDQPAQELAQTARPPPITPHAEHELPAPGHRHGTHVIDLDRVVQDRPVEPELQHHQPLAAAGTAPAPNLTDAWPPDRIRRRPRPPPVVTTWLSGSPSRIRTRTPGTGLVLEDLLHAGRCSDKKSPGIDQHADLPLGRRNRCPQVGPDLGERPVVRSHRHDLAFRYRAPSSSAATAICRAQMCAW